ncbi:hypothetical protein ACJX0J_034186, partial [Zea mays]
IALVNAMIKITLYCPIVSNKMLINLRDFKEEFGALTRRLGIGWSNAYGFNIVNIVNISPTHVF